MSSKSLYTKAIHAINRHGILLVNPINNSKDPRSLWYELFPRSKMVWEWDDESDSRVADLWHLRARLSESREVIYSKWFRNRATFFSKEAFQAFYQRSRSLKHAKWTRESNQILETLQMDSPLSTKQLKEAVHLQGRLLERIYEKAMKPLWQHLDIVGYGEVQDSSFPSLAIAATATLFEDLVNESSEMHESQVSKLIAHATQDSQALAKFARTLQFFD